MKVSNNATGSRTSAFGGASVAALGIALFATAFSGTALAQEAPAADEGDEIIVTGFRASVENAIEAKRSTDFIADIISADDIAGLPDVSIAESLARLPGVSSQRTGGQASALNIRGLSQDLVSATLNGREQVATSGNRTIEFDQYPSELISQAAVYKTPVASIIEGGIAGKVELKTVRPLDSKDSFSGQVNFRGLYNDRANQNPDVSNKGYRASGSVQFKLADDTLGIALGYSRLFQPNVATRFVQFDFPSPGNNGSPVRDLNGDGQPEIFNFGFEGIQFGGRETRDGAIGVVEWKPSDRLTVLIDGYYSRFKSQVKRRGFRVFATQSGENIFQNPVIVNNAVVGGRVISNFQGGFAVGTELVNQDEGRRDELYTIGSNIAYDIFDRLKAALDVSYSSGESFFNNSGINVRPYFFDRRAGVNRIRRTDGSDTDRNRELPTPVGSIIVDSRLNGLNLPTIREISQSGATFTDFNIVDGAGFLLDGQFLVPQRDTDKLFAVAGDLEFDAGDGFIKTIKVGGRYAKRDGNRTVTSFNTFGIPNGPLTLPANLISTGGFEGGFARAGLPNFGVVDIDGAFNLAFGNQLGTRQPTDQITFDFTVDQSFKIDEETYTGYGQIDFSTIAGSLPFRGNIGLRVIRTDQSSTVFSVIPGLVDDRSTPPPLREDRRFITRGKTFTDFLPSANAILEITPKDLLRISYTQQISRPRFVDLRGAISVSTGGDGNTTGGGGNPQLDPFKADQFDLSFEHYFGRSGIISAAAFYKNLRTFVIQGNIPNFNFVANGVTPPPIPGTNRPGNPIGNFSAPVNGQGGFVYGFEFGFSKTFVELPSPFDGLGVVVNYAYSQSDLNTTSATSGRTLNLDLAGLSKHVLNPTIFYEKAGFGARVSGRYRSSFVSPQIGVSELIITSAPETVVDAQISYEFPETSILKGLKLLAQANNLTDEPTRTFFGQREQTGTLQNFGRTFFLGATYKF
jgi:phosphoribosylformimino-5-aminoimidazole carboxamide ribotide isomerase